MKTLYTICIGLFLLLITGAFMQNQQRPIVILEISQGTNYQGKIKIELMQDIAPKACENFLALAKKKYYQGVIVYYFMI